MKLSDLEWVNIGYWDVAEVSATLNVYKALWPNHLKEVNAGPYIVDLGHRRSLAAANMTYPRCDALDAQCLLNHYINMGSVSPDNDGVTPDGNTPEENHDQDYGSQDCGDDQGESTHLTAAGEAVG